MDCAHLRLESTRFTGPVSYAPESGVGGHPLAGAPMEVRLDRRSSSLRAMQGQGAALLGYVLLPWCDVTLWGVVSAAHGDAHAEPDAPALCHECAGARACAWMRVELEHVDYALTYVERLPVEMGLVAKPWRWRWSSASWHCGFGAKPMALAPEWSGPMRRDLWRERLAGTFVGRSDRSVPMAAEPSRVASAPPAIVGSAVDRLVRRADSHSPGIPPSAAAACSAMEPSQGELAVA